MRKRRNQTPVSPTYNLDDEVNVREYPYYRNIPIKSIGEHQQRMRQPYNSPPLLPAPTHHHIPYEEFPPLRSKYDNHQEHNNYEEYNAQQEYSEPPLPVFNLIPVPGENVYRVDMRTMEEKLDEMRREIDANTEKLAEQHRAISVNEESIQKQAHTINTQNGTIHNNTAYIQQQLTAYNHNVSIIQQQTYTYQNNATYITSQQDTLSSLQSQILECEEQLEQLKQETETYQQQSAYHGSMLNAFTTMLQNPQYFTQLMAMSLSSMMPPDADQ